MVDSAGGGWMYPPLPGSFGDCVPTVCVRERNEEGSAEEWGEALEESVEGEMRKVKNLATVCMRTSGHMLWHKNVH